MAISSAALKKLGMHYLPHFDDVRRAELPVIQLANVRKAALDLQQEILAMPRAHYYETVSLIRVPYPTKYGLLNATTVKTPFMHILNRLFIVKFQSSAGIKTLLFSPSEIFKNRETPFFKRLDSILPNAWINQKANALVAPVLSTVEDALHKRRIDPASIDYISFDHLHTQDIRKWLGSATQPGYFPNAKLLVMEKEWLSASGLLPPQAQWYCPQGTDGVPEERIIRLSKSTLLGDGVALVHTPGHTLGNHSLAVHTDEGILVSSENGVSADSYAPMASDIPGVRSYATQTGMEVILNGNTLESGLDQYISMILEKTLAGPSPRNPDFFNVVPSSELSAYWLFPGLKPHLVLASLNMVNYDWSFDRLMIMFFYI